MTYAWIAGKDSYILWRLAAVWSDHFAIARVYILFK